MGKSVSRDGASRGDIAWTIVGKGVHGNTGKQKQKEKDQFPESSKTRERSGRGEARGSKSASSQCLRDAEAGNLLHKESGEDTRHRGSVDIAGAHVRRGKPMRFWPVGSLSAVIIPHNDESGNISDSTPGKFNQEYRERGFTEDSGNRGVDG